MSSSPLRIFLIGGHGKVALHFSRHAVSAPHNHTVFSFIRAKEQIPDLPQSDNLRPVVASIEHSSVDDFVKLFKDADPNVIVWSAGAGGKGGPERTKAVDEEGAIKVFDAIEKAKLPGLKKFVMVSAIDVRDRSKPPPAHYTEEDLAVSERMYKAIPVYMDAKLAADRDLSKRKTFPWMILRPGGLADEPSTGKVELGRTTLTRTIPREDVALTLLEIIEQDAGTGLAWDLVRGDKPISQAVKDAAQKGETNFVV